MNINVGDIIRLEVGDKTRVWRVTGVYLGSVGEENVIGLESLDLRMGACQELFVPMHIYELVVRHWNNSEMTSSFSSSVPSSMPLENQERGCCNCEWHMWDCCDIDGYCGNKEAVRCVPGDRQGWKLKVTLETVNGQLPLPKGRGLLATEDKAHLLSRTKEV